MAETAALATTGTGQLATGPGRPLRVAHLTTVDMSLALLLSTELSVDVAAGFRVFGISAPGPYEPQLRDLGIEPIPIPSLTRAWGPRRDLSAARHLWRVLRELDLDVLHTHNPKTGVMGRILGRLAGVPVVVNTCHGLWATSEDRWAKRAAVYAAESVAAWFSHSELYQNDADRMTLRRFVGSDRQRTVGNGTDLERFRPDPRARVRVRRELGLADDDVLVGGVGRRVAEKGIHEFAAVAAALGDRARFVWIGPTDEDKPDGIHDEDDAVTFLGLRHDMEAVYAALDVFVLPSHREGFSRSGMEAAASGCAMVLTDIRGCREIGGHEREVVLVPPRDVAALTDAVERLIADPSRRAALGRAARQRALEHFDQRRIATVSIDTYRAVAARRGFAWPAG